jgi:TPR repeat protein
VSKRASGILALAGTATRWFATSLLCLPLLASSLLAQVTHGDANASASDESVLREQQHFTECLIYAFSPALWISRNGSLYFLPKDDVQAQKIESMKAERADYVTFTNLQARHEFAANAVTASGLEPAWQAKLIPPWSPTNRDLLPTLDKPLRLLPTYKLLQTLSDGDALLQNGQAVYFVMDYGRAPQDAFRTNAILIKEGTKTYRTVAGISKTVEAFTDAGLNREEIAVLNRVVTVLRKNAALLSEAIAGFKAKQQYEEHRARADETNPYMEFLLANDYLTGTGTPKDEALGLDWMQKAARHGSGDAEAYLAKLKTRQQ